MRCLHGRRALLAAASVGALQIGGNCQAQPAHAATIEEVVVTARRTAESAQNVPLTIAVVSGEQLRRERVGSANDLTRIVPGLATTQGSGGGSVVNLSIRGQVNTDTLLTADPAVGVYVNEVVWPRAVGLRSGFYDLASVEVLEGPQGTLFGKNTTGGAMLITTQQARLGETGGYVEGELSDYRGRRLTGAVNVPLASDTLALRLAGQFRQRGGFGNNALGKATSNLKEWSIRGSLRWQPTDDLEVLATGDQTRYRSAPPNVRLLYVVGCTKAGVACTGAPLPTSLTSPLPRYDVSGALIPGTYGAGFGSSVLSEAALEMGLDTSAASLTQAQALLSTFLPGGVNDPGFHNSPNAELGAHDSLDLSGGMLQVNYDHWGLKFRSITGLRVSDRSTNNPYSPFNPGPGRITPFTLPNGVTVAPFAVTQGSSDTDARSFTQEFQVQRQSTSGLSFTGGLFYQHEKGTDGGPAYSLVRTTPQNVPNIADGDVTNKSYSAYGQAVYPIVEGLRLTAGVRYTRDEKSLLVRNKAGVGPLVTGVINSVTTPSLAAAANAAVANPGLHCSLDPTILRAGVTPYLTVIRASGTTTFFSPDPSICSAFREKSFTSTNYLVGLDWQAAPDILLYGRVSSGYKGGGFNLRALNAPGLVPFNPEKTTEFEAGVKSEWLEQRLRVNASGYFTQYKNIQRQQTRAVPAPDGSLRTATVTGNAAEAEIYGVETTVVARPTAALVLTAGASYNHGKYKKYLIPVATNAVTGEPTAFNDLSNLEFPLPAASLAPRFRYTLNGVFTAPTAWGDLTTNLNWAWQSAQRMQPTPAREFVRVKSYGLLDARVTLHVEAWDSDVSIFGRNLLDKDYFQGVQDFGSLGYFVGFTGDPRLVGVEFRKKFGGE